VGSGVGVGVVDKTLMDIGGWVDAAVRDWQVSWWLVLGFD